MKPEQKSRALEAQPLGILDVPSALLNIRTVETATDLCKTTVYAMIREKSFPAPLKLSKRCSRWRSSDVRGWLDARAGA